MTRSNRRRRLSGLLAGLTLVIGATALAVTGASPAAQAVEMGNTEIIRSYPTGLCVDSNKIPGREGGDAYSHPCHLGTWQQWREAPPRRLEGTDTGLRPFANEYQLVNVQTGLCLENHPSGAVYTKPCEARNDNQSWIHVIPALEPGKLAKLPDDPNAWPVVYLNLATDRCLAIGSDRQLATVTCTGKFTDYMFFRRGY